MTKDSSKGAGMGKQTLGLQMTDRWAKQSPRCDFTGKALLEQEKKWNFVLIKW